MKNLHLSVGGVVALSLLLIWNFNFWVLSELDNQLAISSSGINTVVGFDSSVIGGVSTTSSKQRSALQSASKTDDRNNGYTFHIVVSSGCNSLQDWQSYMFFYNIKISGFKGDVTRVASCETKEAANLLKTLHKEQIAIMSPNFHLHTTPDYANLVKPKYNFFNKPFGIRHWMEHGLGLPANLPKYEKTIIVIMDPDQALLRPFVQDMTDEPEVWSDPNGYKVVKRGQPMAAKYEYGGTWINKINVDQLLQVNATIKRVSRSESGLNTWTPQLMTDHFTIGAPYVAVMADMFEIVVTWAEFVVPIHAQMGDGTFMAEMYGYDAAAAHLNLPHQMSNSFMISNTAGDSSSEAWRQWVDGRSSEDVCSMDMNPVPHTLHFCQRYYIGEYFFSKYKLPTEPPNDIFLSCQHPLLKEPPKNVADIYNSSQSLDGTPYKLSPRDRIRMAFVICQMFPRLNGAATFYKDHHCKDDSANPGNYSKVFVFEQNAVKDKRLKREREARKRQIEQKN